MFYRATIRLRGMNNALDKAALRKDLAQLIDKHGGKNGTPNPRNHVVGIFTAKAAMKAFRAEVRGNAKL